jgi:2'-5' RNA ligase
LYGLGKLRTFLSLNTGSGDINRLTEVQKDVMNALGKYQIKWENPEKLHMTLRFLGDVNEDRLESLIFTLERLKTEFESIKFTANSIGFFPNPKYPNVVFIALDEKGNNAEKLVEFIDKIIYNFGVKPEKRFIPHITLGRFKRDKRVKIEQPVNIQMEPIDLEFDSFCLMKSILTPAGSVYEVISNFKFNK